MNAEDIPLTPLHSFELFQVTVQDPSGAPIRAVDLVLKTAPRPEGPLRFRLSYHGVEALAHSLAEAAERTPDKLTRIHREVSTAQLTPIQVTTDEGPKSAFLLRLEQKNIEGRAELPVEVALEPDLVISFAEMFLDAVGGHGLTRNFAPSTTAPQSGKRGHDDRRT